MKRADMSAKMLQKEIEDGVNFLGWVVDVNIVGVMGIPYVTDIALIRHAYVLPKHWRLGIGGKILRYLISLSQTEKVLEGIWEADTWAIDFYTKFGFKLVSHNKKNMLLKSYWKISYRQIDASVVLQLKKK